MSLRSRLSDPDSGENHERIRTVARRLLESPDGREIIRGVIRYTLNEAATRPLILSAFTESDDFKKGLEQRVAETRETLLRDANAACEEAEAVFEGTLRAKRATAVERAQKEAQNVVDSIQVLSAKKLDDLRVKFESEIERRTEGVSRSFTEWIDRTFARYERTLGSKLDELIERRAERFIRDAVHDLFVAILGQGATTRMEDARTAGREEGRSEGYRQGYTVGHGEGTEEGTRRGYQEGHSDGHSEGFAAGRSEGFEYGFRDGFDRRATEDGQT